MKIFFGKFFEICLILTTFLPLYGLTFMCLVCIGIPSFMIQYLVKIFAKFLHPEWAGMMSGKDAIMGTDNTFQKSRNILLWYNMLERDVSLEEIRTNFDELIVKRKDPSTGRLVYPKYQQYYESWCGYNFWKWDYEFDIRNHVKMLPGSNELNVTNEKQLLSRLAPLMTDSFSMKRPYWECFCVPNYLPKGEKIPNKTLIIYRMHHGIGDGYSFLKCFMQHLCNDNLEKVIKLKESSNLGKREKSKFWQFLNQFWFFIQIPYVSIKQCFIDIDSNVWFISKDSLQDDCHLSMTKKISVSSIKQVYKRYNVSFATVLFSALAGGINKYLKWKNFDSKSNEIPKIIRCFTPFPWKNHPNNKLTNHWTCASVPIFPNIDSPKERMELIEENLEALKKSPIAFANYIIIPLIAMLPVQLIKIVGSNWFNTCILSNFPGPTQSCSYYKKYKVEDINFWAPSLNGKAGIGITMMSYGDTLRFGLNFDKAILPNQEDVDDLCSYIEDEFEKLFKTNKMVLMEDILIPQKNYGEDENQNGIQLEKRRFNFRHRSVS